MARIADLGGDVLAFSSAPSVLVSPTGIGFKGFSADVARLPEVTSAGPVAGLNAFVLDPKPPRDFMFGAPFFPLDDRYGRTINRPKLRGRGHPPSHATAFVYVEAEGGRV